MTDWQDIFDAQDVPAWLEDFDRDPLGAVDAALWRRYYFGDLNVTDPSDLLIDWTNLIGKRNDFAVRLDESLNIWIDRTWGIEPVLGGGNSAAATSVAWIRVFEIVANIRTLTKSALALRRNLSDSTNYLGPLSKGPSRDPLGRYIYAIARRQTDRSLLPFWWKYCDLVTGIPSHHGQYGIWGLRCLPSEDEGDRLDFPDRVPIGLICLASALFRRGEDGLIESTEAKSELYRVASITSAAYPFPEIWRAIVSEYLASKRIEEEPQEWLKAFFPSANGNKSSRKRSRKELVASPSPGWRSRADQAEKLLARDFEAGHKQADSLLQEEAKYAERTGEAYGLVRSLTRFAKAVCSSNPSQAIRWAEEARQWEPWNPFPWTVLIQAVRGDRKRGTLEALSLAWEAVERFPENPFARTALAEVLKDQGKADEAEKIYRETITQFPDNHVALNGLAGVLKQSGKLHEAEKVYRETIKAFQNEVITRNGLGEVLKEAGRLSEAEQVYLETIEAFPKDVASRNGLAVVLKEARRLGEAERVYRETIKAFPNDVIARNGLAVVLKEAGRLPEAEHVYRETINAFANDAVTRNGLAVVLKEAGRLEEAEQVYRETIEAFPSSVVTRNGLADVLKEAGRLKEAETIYRETIKAFPNAAVSRNGLAEVLKEAGKLGEAERVYRETIKAFPNDVIAPNGLAAVLRLLGKESLVEASKIVADRLEKKPMDARTLSEKARILEELGEMVEADATFQEASRAASSKDLQAEQAEVTTKSIELPAQETAIKKSSEPEVDLGEVTVAIDDADSLTAPPITEEARQSASEPSQAETSAAGDEAEALITRGARRRIEHMNDSEVIIRCSYARFLRRWARQNAKDGKAPDPLELRNRAVSMLDTVISSRPLYARALTEKALLLLECKQFQEAKNFLAESIELRPADIALQYALARTEREIADHNRLSLADVGPKAVTAKWRALQLMPELRPLVNLGSARSWLAHVDGDTVSEKALVSFEKARKWMRPHLSFVNSINGNKTTEPEDIRSCYKLGEGFSSWWSREVQAFVFGGIEIDKALTLSDLSSISNRLEQYALSIDTLEEDFAIHYSFAQIPY